MELEYIPLNYYQHFKRFINYIAATTDWNLAPLLSKLENTHYYFNSER